MHEPEPDISGNDNVFQDEGAQDHSEAAMGRRRPFVSMESCDQKMLAITNHLGPESNNVPGYAVLRGQLAKFMTSTLSWEALHEAVKVSLGPVSRNQTGWKSYQKMLDQHLASVTSEAPVAKVGHPVSKRLRAGWEGGSVALSSQSQRVMVTAGAAGPSSNSQRPVVGIQPLPPHTTDQRPFGWCLNFEGRQGQLAIDYLARWGAMETWIVEVYPEKEAAKRGDRWFMTITDGKVQGPEKDQYITACRWHKVNSTSELDPDYPDKEKCELRQVKGYGPPKCPIFY
jgi:hypothetical protein